MFDSLVQLDRELLLELNSYNNPFFDEMMYWVSHKFFWLPLYLFLVYLIIRKNGWNAVYVLVGVALVVTLADQFTSSFMKPFFERPRPCHDPLIGHMVHTVEKCGGRYGFASSHASNVFGVAAFLWLQLRDRFRWIILLFPWAVLVSYSRVYLGVHYPGDITVGAIVGLFFGWLVYWIYNQLSPRLPSLDRQKDS
ncbi:phosphatase PAP2 family protein [Nafulsella turpanensis]|uniref:phosphatase PAP2 family protein n=1 Tax=Nafulsella turpanensis TaxID=1265690 RepID=UPI000344E943|nr:phosphatase PAP2 family protein [Nafulsella turpanensis]